MPPKAYHLPFTVDWDKVNDFMSAQMTEIVAELEKKLDKNKWIFLYLPFHAGAAHLNFWLKADAFPRLKMIVVNMGAVVESIPEEQLCEMGNLIGQLCKERDNLKVRRNKWREGVGELVYEFKVKTYQPFSKES